MAIGYACQVVGIPNTGITGCTLKNATPDKIRSVILSNIEALTQIMDYNIENNITLFRISSDIIPFGSHPVNQIHWWEEFREELDRLGQRIRRGGIRVSMHPGQYTVLNSFDSGVVANARKDLEYHDRFLSSLGMDFDCKLVLHIGGVYGDKLRAMQSFISNYNTLSESVKNRLIIENDDKNYNIDEVLQVSEQTGLPVVFDNLHHKINPPKVVLSDLEWIKKCKETWTKKDGKQKIHYSQQKVGASIGSHSETIILKEFLDYYESLQNQDINLMLEVKDKNLSAIKCNIAVNNNSYKALNKEWERYHYFILSRSTRIVKEITELFEKEERNIVQKFYGYVEEALSLPEDKEAQIHAANSIWRELWLEVTNTERNRYEKLMTAYQNDTGPILPLKNHLYGCAIKSGKRELINSLYFYL